jgi:hypothetical protein
MPATNDFILATHMLGCKAMVTAIIATAIILDTIDAYIRIVENITMHVIKAGANIV